MSDDTRIHDLEARIDGLLRQRATHLERIAALEAENERLRTVRDFLGDKVCELAMPPTAHHDLLPMRAETEADEERD